MKLISSVLLFIFATLVFGCNPVFYSPPAQNVPLLSQKGELAVSGGGILTDRAQGGNFQGAYSVAPHIGLVAGGTFHAASRDSSKRAYKFNQGLINVGAGYFTHISTKFIFEVYGLLGYGWMNHFEPATLKEHPETNGRMKADLFNVAIQPAVGFKSKNFEAAISIKAGVINYSNIQGQLIANFFDFLHYPQIDMQAFYRKNRHVYLYEPALTFLVGADRIKLRTQFGLSRSSIKESYPNDDFWVTAGLSFRLAK